MAGTVRVKANLPGYLLPVLLFSKYITRKCFSFKMKVKVTEYTTFTMVPLDGEYQPR